MALMHLTETLAKLLTARGLCCAVAESCTGGSLAATITAIPGASVWFERGFITYSNLAKQEMLSVPEELVKLGAVNAATACAMAEGALLHSRADLAVSITGIAGPGGGTKDKPVGTVWIGYLNRGGKAEAVKYYFQGDRVSIREQAVQAALVQLISCAKVGGYEAKA